MTSGGGGARGEGGLKLQYEKWPMEFRRSNGANSPFEQDGTLYVTCSRKNKGFVRGIQSGTRVSSAYLKEISPGPYD